MKPGNKRFTVDIDFQPIELHISAKNKREARKKAVANLKRTTAYAVVGRAFPSRRRQIAVEED